MEGFFINHGIKNVMGDNFCMHIILIWGFWEGEEIRRYPYLKMDRLGLAEGG